MKKISLTSLIVENSKLKNENFALKRIVKGLRENIKWLKTKNRLERSEDLILSGKDDEKRRKISYSR